MHLLRQNIYIDDASTSPDDIKGPKGGKGWNPSWQWLYKYHKYLSDYRWLGAFMLFVFQPIILVTVALIAHKIPWIGPSDLSVVNALLIV